MTFKYEEAVPWGRSFDEYRRMFALTDDDLERRILGCADGPAGFNAEVSRRGQRVVSCDPLYQCSADQIRQRIDATYDNVMRQTGENRDRFVWERIRSLEELGRTRMDAMHQFLCDYDHGKSGSRYVAAALPDLPFASSSFDVALCSHFLFFYADNLSLAFHQQAVDELCRVAQEVRVFPLLTYNSDACPFVDAVTERQREAGRQVSIERVAYEFQRGGHTMMRIAGRGQR
jgi:hypothetical protein